MTEANLSLNSRSKKPLLLTISIVTFNPDFIELRNTLYSLETALTKIDKNAISITIIDNSDNDLVPQFLEANCRNMPIRLVRGQGNIGFGRAHNLALNAMAKFHLILNPDIELHADALITAVDFMTSNPQCGLLTPHARWPNGERQYLCKRYPAAFDLLLRGFAPKMIRSFFEKRLSYYEMQQETQDNIYWNPPIVSGCFMFFRSAILEKTKGFNDSFFLYFEDFDLSLRTHKFASIAYVPTVKVIHSGGKAGKKGRWHIKVFISSAIKFYRTHKFKIF